MSASVWGPDRDGLAAAAAALHAGGVVGFPTDTVYGLAASAALPEAVAAISRVKGRSPEQPLILMVAAVEELREYCELGPVAAGLARRFWPGPLTLILPAVGAGAALGGMGTVGVRIPRRAEALGLLRIAGPLATTSANRHGAPPLAGAAEAMAALGGLAGVVQAAGEGPSGGLPSSILDLTREPPALLRRGSIGPEELEIPGLEDLSGARRD